MFDNVHAKIASMKNGKDRRDIDSIKENLREARPLPIGVTEFNEWSDRIIQGAMIKATDDSLKFSLAAMLLQLGQREIFKDDHYFICALRKVATDQTAQYVMSEMKKERAERILKESSNPGAVTPNSGVTNEVLRDETV